MGRESIKWLVVAVVFLLLAPGKTLLLEDPDPATLLPEDITFYFALHNPSEGYDKLKSLLEEIFYKKGVETLFEFLKESALMWIPPEASKLISHAVEKHKSIKSIHIASKILFGNISEFSIILKFGQEIPQKILQQIENLFPKARTMQGIRVYWLKPLPLYLASFGRICVIAERQMLGSIILRYRGKRQGGSLAESELYRRLNSLPVPGGKFFMEGLFSWRSWIRGLSRFGRKGFDPFDAVFEFTKIKGLIVRSRIDKGLCKTDAKILLQEDALIWELVREKPTRKELLRFFPEKTLLGVLYKINDPVKRWKRLSGLINEIVGEEAMEYLSSLSKALDGEIAFFIPTYLFKKIRPCGPSDSPFCAIFKLKGKKDRETIEEIMEDIFFEGPPWEEKEYKGVKIYCKVDAVHAFIDEFFLMASSEGEIRSAIRAYKEGRSILEARDKLSADPSEKCSMLAILNTRYLYALLQTIAVVKFRSRLPSMRRDFKKYFDLLFTRDGPDGPSIRVSGNLTNLFLAILPGLLQLLGLESLCTTPFEEEKPLLAPAEPLEERRDDKELKKLIKRLVAQLGADDFKTRESATERLTKIGKPAVGELVKALKSTDPEVRLRAESILWELGECDHCPERLKDWIQQEVKDRRWIVYIFVNDERIGLHISQHLGATAPTQRDLMIARSRLAKRLLIELAGDRRFDTYVRRRAGYFLARVGKLPEVDKLEEALKESKDVTLRRLLLLALAKTPGKESRRLIIKYLREGNEEDCKFLCIFFVEKSDYNFVPELIELLDSGDVFRRFHAGYTLERLAQGTIRFNAWWEEKRRRLAIQRYRRWWQKNRGNLLQ